MGERLTVKDQAALELVEAVVAGKKPLDVDENVDDLIDALAELSANGILALQALLDNVQQEDI